MSWFRLYDGLLDDPKAQRLPPETFKGWVNILCLASRHEGVLPEVEDVAFALRMSEQETRQLLVTLHNAGLLDDTEQGLEPHNWQSRQYKSDVSTERVKRFRKRSETVSETLDETPPEQSRADTEQSRTERGDAPRKRVATTGTRLPENWLPSVELMTWAVEERPGMDLQKVIDSFTDYWRGCAGAKGRKADWDATFRNWVRRENGTTARSSTGNRPVRETGAERIARQADEGRRRILERSGGAGEPDPVAAPV